MYVYVYVCMYIYVYIYMNVCPRLARTSLDCLAVSTVHRELSLLWAAPCARRATLATMRPTAEWAPACRARSLWEVGRGASIALPAARATI